MTREEMGGSIEMAFAVWGAVGPSHHVLDEGPDPPMVKGNFGWFPFPLKSVKMACFASFMTCATVWRKTMRRFIELLRSLVNFSYR